jgi:hypothetical protein
VLVDDLRPGRLRHQDALDLYGVIVDEHGEVDIPATDTQRRAITSGRLETARPPQRPQHERHAIPDGATHLVEGVAIIEGGDGAVLACARCGQQLSKATESYRVGCAELDTDPTEHSDLFTSALDGTGTPLIMRAYACPSCGRILDVILCHPEDALYCDARLI